MLEIENEMKRVILFFTIKHNGNWEKIYNAIKTKEDISLSEMNSIKEKYQTHYISIVDKQYPDNYKEIYMPPLSIFMTGNPELLAKQNIIHSLWSANNYSQLAQYQFDKEQVYAIFLTSELIPMINELSADGIKFILINKHYTNSPNIESLNFNDNLLHIAEIPKETKKPDIADHQNCERLLLGVSKHSTAIDIDTTFIKTIYPLFEFEKRILNTKCTDIEDFQKYDYLKTLPENITHKD